MTERAECHECGGCEFHLFGLNDVTCADCGEPVTFERWEDRECEHCDDGTTHVPACFCWWQCAHCNAENGDRWAEAA